MSELAHNQSTAFLTLSLVALLILPSPSHGERLEIASLAAINSVSYTIAKPELPSRLQMVEEIGQKYGLPSKCRIDDIPPAMVEAFPALPRLGLLGGIYVNTFQQHKTGRDQLLIWSIPNSALTVEPYAYSREFEAGQSCENSPFIASVGAQPVTYQGRFVDRHMVCRAWHSYFLAAQNDRINSPQRLLWHAHSLSLLHAWMNNAPAFNALLEENAVPRDEYLNWSAWSRLVGAYLPRYNFSSCGSEMRRNLHDIMPDCILGAGACPITVPAMSLTDQFIRLLAVGLLRTLRTDRITAAIDGLLYELDERIEVQ